MKIYSYNPFTKIFSNEAVADKNQLNPSEYILPAFCTTIQPPSFPQGKQAFWNGSAWQIQDIPQPEPEPEPELPQIEPEPEPEPEPISWEYVRSMRSMYLKYSDWVVLPDSNPPNKEAWLTYRQALRNIPQTFTTPESVVWPITP